MVFKRHPRSIRPGSETPDLERALRVQIQTNPFAHVVDANVHSLIAASAGVVINSGVGFEALFHGKPVLTFGDCDYRCVTLPLNLDRGMRDALVYVRDHGPIERLPGYRFVHHYRTRHAFDLREPRERIDRRLREQLRRILPADG